MHLDCGTHRVTTVTLANPRSADTRHGVLSLVEKAVKSIVLGLVLAGLAAVVLSSPALAGTTLITHGFTLASPDPPNWTLTLGRAILAADGDPSGCGGQGNQTPRGSLFVYEPSTGAWEFECGSTTPIGEIVLIYNWSQESDGLNIGGTQGFAEAAGDALYAALRDPQFPAAFSSVDPLADPVHFIGHSRGAVVNSDCIERLAAAGIAVDHVTTLDPHPVDGTLDFPLDLADWLDRAPVTWDNITFADNYWRADGGGVAAIDFDGMSLPTDVNLDIEDGIDGFLDIDPPFEHTEVHAWYHGTIDLTANDDGDGTPIDDDLFSDWWGNSSIPNRDATGFYHSAIIGGSRPGSVAGTVSSWSPLSIYNGDFETVNTEVESLGIGYAGWYYHGGSRPVPAVPWSSLSPPAGSNFYLTLFGDGAYRTATHNRLYVDGGAGSLEFERRVSFPSANDRLVITLVDSAGSQTVVDVALTSSTAWETVAFPIPIAGIGQTWTLKLEIDGGGDGVESIVNVDNLRFIPEPGHLALLSAGVIWLGMFGRGRARR